MTKLQNVTVNDIDGDTCHTIDHGTIDEVLGRADERLAGQIARAVEAGGDLTETFDRDGDTYTTRVIVEPAEHAMNHYYIYTDEGQFDDIEAASIADALRQTDLPASVTDAESFVAYLEGLGGYGEIRENDETIAAVPAAAE